MIVLRTPKGWTGPDVVDGVQVRGTWRAHQVPLSGVKDNPEHLAMLEDVAAVVPAGGAVRRRRRARPSWSAGPTPSGDLRMSATPARQRRSAHPRPRPARLPRLRRRRRRRPATVARRVDPQARRDDARRLPRQPRPLPAVLPGRDQQQPARRRVRGVRPRVHGAGHRRRRRPVPRRPGDGGAVRAQLPRVAGGLHPDRAARLVRDVRGVRHGERVADHPALQVAAGGRQPAVAREGARASTSCSPRPRGATTTTASATRARA